MNPFFIVIVCLFLFSCILPGRHDPTAHKIDKHEMEKIPPVCRSVYDISEVRVVIAPFTNNSTFDKAEVSEQASQSTTDVTSKESTRKKKRRDRTKSTAKQVQVTRKVDTRLCDSIDESVKNEIANIGPIKVYSRQDLPKIFEEQTFQSSGLVDEKQMVKIGKMAAARYIITGSLNNAYLSNYRCPEQKDRESSRKKSTTAEIIEASAYAACKAIEGWRVQTSLAIRMIDVETGEVTYSQVVEGKEIIGDVDNPNPSYDTIVGAIKKAAGKAVKDIKPMLSRLCALRGYIIQTRSSADGKERSALINLGQKNGLKPNQSLTILTFQEVKDPITNKVSCDIIKLAAEIEITEQIQADKAWGKIVGNEESIKRVRIGNLVETGQITGGQGIIEKVGL